MGSYQMRLPWEQPARKRVKGVQQPGMLMIPKTLAYVGIAGLAYGWMRETA